MKTTLEASYHGRSGSEKVCLLDVDLPDDWADTEMNRMRLMSLVADVLIAHGGDHIAVTGLAIHADAPDPAELPADHLSLVAPAGADLRPGPAQTRGLSRGGVAA